jgi:hypothetical protein
LAKNFILVLAQNEERVKEKILSKIAEYTDKNLRKLSADEIKLTRKWNYGFSKK